MAFTKVVGPGIHTLAQLRTHNIHSAGIITATKFVGEMESGGGSSTFENVTVNGNLTVQGDTTTLNTTLRNVELLRVEANTNTAAGIITQTGTGDILNLFDGTTEVMTVVDGGNVGIGLTNPTKLLELKGTDPTIKLWDSSGDAYALIEGDSADEGSIRFRADPLGGGGSTHIRFDVDGTEALRITSAAKVGIGTINPQSKLTVAADSAQAIIELKRTNTNTTGAVGTINWTALDGHSVANISAKGDGDNEGANIIFRTTSSAASNDPYNAATVERLRIASDGEVGIGTVNPNAPLDVFSNTAATNEDLFMVRSATGAFAVQCSNVTAANPEWRLRTYSNEPIVFSPGNVEKVRITPTGLVGINTDTPGTNHNLEILGNAGAYAMLNVKTQSLAHGSALELGAMDDDDYGSIYQFASGAGEGARMRFIAGGTETMNLRGGALLIGLSAPTYSSGDMQHEIKKNNSRTYTAPLMTAHSHLLLNNSDTTDTAFCGLGFRAGSGDGSIGFVYRGSTNNSDFVINTDSNANGKERFRIYNNGAVLIGDHATEGGGDARLSIDCEGLDVFDGVGDAANYGLIFANDPTTNKANGIGFFNDSGSTCGGYIVHQDTGGSNIGDLVFGTAASADSPIERLRIKSDGTVGIGTDSPGSPLEVNGGSALNTATFNSHHANGILINLQRSGTNKGFIGSGKNIADATGGVDDVGMRAQANLIFTAGGDTERLRINSDGKVGVNVSSFTSGGGKESIMQIKAPNAYSALGIGATTFGITFGWDGDRSAYDDLRIYNVDYDNSGTFGIGGNNPTFILTPTSAPGSGISQQTVWLKSTGRGSGNTDMNMCVDGDVVIGGSGQGGGNATSGYPPSWAHGTGVSKLTIQPDHRTSAFDPSDGDTWHDVVLHQGGSATNNAVGIAFQLKNDGSYHKNAGTGIAAVKNGTNSDYGADLVFIVRGQSEVASEKLRITSTGVIQTKSLSGTYYPVASIRDGSTSGRAASSAWEIKKTLGPAAQTGYYYLTDMTGTTAQWWCDMETDGGGWILIAHCGEGQMSDQSTSGDHWFDAHDRGGFDTVSSGHKEGGGYWRGGSGEWAPNTCGQLMWDVRVHNQFGFQQYGYHDTAESASKVVFNWGTDQAIPTGNSGYGNIPNAGSRRFNEWCYEVQNAPGFNPSHYHQNVRGNIISGHNHFTEHMVMTWSFRGTGGAAADGSEAGPYWMIGAHAAGLHQHYEESLSGDSYGDGAYQVVSNQDTSWQSNAGGTYNGMRRLAKIDDSGTCNIWMR